MGWENNSSKAMQDLFLTELGTHRRRLELSTISMRSDALSALSADTHMHLPHYNTIRPTIYVAKFLGNVPVMIVSHVYSELLLYIFIDACVYNQQIYNLKTENIMIND